MRYTREDVHGITQFYYALGDSNDDYKKWEYAMDLYEKFLKSEYNLPHFSLDYCINIFINNLLLKGVRL